MTIVVAQEVDCGEYRIECPECSHSHILNQVSKELAALDRDADDDFFVLEDGTLYPMFVCRNPSCSFEGVVALIRDYQ